MKWHCKFINRLYRAITCLSILALLSLGMGLASNPVEAQPFAYVGGGNNNDVVVIDIATNTVVATVGVGLAPDSVAITPDGARAYVTNANSAAVSVIDTATNTVTATIPVGVIPRGVAITPDGAFAYVTNQNSNNVSVIDTDPTSPTFNTVVATVAVGVTPFRVAITPDGVFAYVTNNNSGTVSVIATATNTVVATVGIGASPVGVAITPDGAFAYVTDTASGNVSVIDTDPTSPTFNTVVATVFVGAQPFAVAITPDGAFAYLPNGLQGFPSNVAVIATATNTVVATVFVGFQPFAVAITPDGAFAYVVKAGSNDVAVIATATNTVVATVPLGAGRGGGVAITPLVADELTPQEQIEGVIAKLQNIDSESPAANKAEDAIAKLQTALEELNKPDNIGNQAALGNIEGAVGELEVAIGLDPAQDPTLTDCLDQLAEVARQLAADAIDQAIARVGISDPIIAEAQQFLADGDNLLGLIPPRLKDAVARYKDAKATAESAQP